MAMEKKDDASQEKAALIRRVIEPYLSKKYPAKEAPQIRAFLMDPKTGRGQGGHFQGLSGRKAQSTVVILVKPD